VDIRSIKSDAAAPAVARSAVSAITDALSDERTSVIRLLVSELVTNGIKHGRNESIELSFEQRPTSVWVEISSASNGSRPELVHDQSLQMGLQLVDQLASDWGHHTDDDQTRVWFELDITGAGG
jgi:anti-sigma regulatory factor (Ser/Thr protein kinase)